MLVAVAANSLALWILAATHAESNSLPTYGFAQAISRALDVNVSAVVAREEIARAGALLSQTRAGALPIVYGTVTGSRIDQARARALLQPVQTLSAAATLVVPLVNVQRWVQWSHAAENEKLSRLSAADIARTLALTTGHVYLAVVAEQRVVEVSDRAFATAHAHYDYAHRKRLGGLGNLLDEVRAEQEEQTSRSQAEQARTALYRAQETLGVMLAEQGPVDVAPEVPLGAPLPIDIGLHQAPALRSDVLLAQARREAAAHVRRDSYADYLPSLMGQAQPFWQDYVAPSSPERAGWQGLLVLSIPLFDGGYREGARAERQALENEANAAFENTLRQVSSDVRTAFESVLRADEALDAAQQAGELGHVALELANKAYRAGAINNLDVIDAERRARDSDTAAAIAEDAARQARLDLLGAAGRFP